MQTTQSTEMLWEQLAKLCPKLRSHIRISRQLFRGQRWYVLRDETTGKHLRISAAAFDLVGRFDGHLTVSTIYAYLQENETELDQQAVISVISNLHSLGALQGVTNKTAAQLIQEQHQRRGANRWAKWLNPLVIRIPLLDPDPLLEKLSPYCRCLFSRSAVLLWLVTVMLGVVVLLSHLTEVADEFRNEVQKPQNLILLWLLYPLLKVIHELAHGVCVKNWGGEVHEMGITFLVFAPVPYVDASASTSFPSKQKRIIVSIAGIAVELLAAALAIMAWALVEDGLLRDCAFGIFLIGAVSSLLFNANPLLKFDGYYVLQDLLEIPNLYSRSLAYYRYLCKRHILGLHAAESPQTAPGEHKWFLIFGALSQVYRFALMLFIVVFLTSRFAILGAMLGAYALFQQFCLPLYRACTYLGKAPELSGIRRRSVLRVVAIALLLLIVPVLVPLPHSTRAQGVVWVPEQGEVFAGAAGFVQRVVVAPGTRVSSGQVLLELSNPSLIRDIAALEADLQVLNINIASDTGQRHLLSNERAVLEERLAQRQKEKAALVVRANTDGIFVRAGYDIVAGRYYDRGEIIGQVVDSEQLIVRVVVPESKSGSLHQGIKGASIRLAENPLYPIAAFVQQQTPAANHTLPSATLGVWGGGGIALATSDPNGLTTSEKVFHLQLSIVSQTPIFGLGGRAYVKLQHTPMPLASRWVQSVQQLFLEYLPT